MIRNLISNIIQLSEKAANISRICRQDKHLLSFLVQEKTGSEKNPRFVQDFKTLADVLVQEVVKYELEKNWPALKGNIYGEESNIFQNEQETIIVEIKDSQRDTEELLFKILNDEKACEVLAREVHRSLNETEIIFLDEKLPDEIAIWIDPIDSTAEYIHGSEEWSEGLVPAGVQCVTVLIGVFNKHTGEPIAGVINQPFHQHFADKWAGEYVYGVNLESLRVTGPNSFENSSTNVVVVSSSEDLELRGRLSAGGYRVVEAAGAGYKLLSVIKGQAAAYVLSKASTYPWDVCACDAVLRALGGGVVSFTTRRPLTYSTRAQPNSEGIIAYIDPSVLQRITTLLDAPPT